MMNLPPELQGMLLDRRLLFVRGRLDEANANGVIGQLLLVARADPSRSIELYIDSPGGSLGASLALYDVIQTLGVPVSTTCTGTTGGAAVLVLAGGAGGQRYALPHARIHLVEERIDVPAGNGNADQAARLRTRWMKALVKHSAHSVARLERDLTAGQWLSAAEARDYGFVDGILPGK